MNKKFLKYTMVFLAALATLSSCEKSASEVYENKAFLDGYVSSKTLYISIENSYQETLTAMLPRPVGSPVKIKYVVDESCVGEYNERYGTAAVLLPAENYTFSAQEMTIAEGGVRSDECVIDFKDVLSLDKKNLYVLPVRLSSDDIDVLASRSVKYYVFEGAKLVNDAAFMWDNFCTVKWNNPDPVSNLKQLTVEMLLNCDWDYNKTTRKNNQNNSLFGIEGYFLFRTGDLSDPNNQLQVCTNNGGPLLGYMPYSKWFNLIVTYDCSTRQLVMYVNGEQVGEATAGSFPDGVTFYTEDNATDPFKINTAYDNTRTAGAIYSEVRIWNKILDAETIADQATHPYFVDPASEGLVAYWKFNEGTGKVISDRSGNGNDLTAVNPIDWRKVSLPED